MHSTPPPPSPPSQFRISFPSYLLCWASIPAPPSTGPWEGRSNPSICHPKPHQGSYVLPQALPGQVLLSSRPHRDPTTSALGIKSTFQAPALILRCHCSLCPKGFPQKQTGPSSTHSFKSPFKERCNLPCLAPPNCTEPHASLGCIPSAACVGFSYFPTLPCSTSILPREGGFHENPV